MSNSQSRWGKPVAQSTDRFARPSSSNTASSSATQSWREPSTSTSTSRPAAQQRPQPFRQQSSTQDIRQSMQTRTTSDVQQTMQQVTVSNSKTSIVPGTVGRRIQLYSNHYNIDVLSKSFQQWYVEFENPAVANVDERRRAIGAYRRDLMEYFGVDYDFDGINLVTNKNCDISVFSRTDPITKQQIIVKFIKLIQNTNTGTSLELITTINNYIKQYLRKLNLIQINNTYFDDSNTTTIQSQQTRLSVLSGFRAIVHAAVNTMQLIVEVAHKPISDISVYDVMQQIEDNVRRDSSIPAAQKQQVIEDRVNSKLRGCVVYVKYSKRTHRIDYIDYELKPTDTFENRDGTTIQYKEHLKQRFGIHCKQQSSGLIVNLPRRKSRPDDKIGLLPEFCYVTGIGERMKSDNRLMQQFADLTRMPANERYQKQAKLINRIITSSNIDSPVNISAEQQPIPARILQGPTITFADGRTGRTYEKTVDGRGFMRDAANSGVLEGSVDIENVSIMYEHEYEYVADEVIKQICRLGSNNKIYINERNVTYVNIPIDQRNARNRVAEWKLHTERVVNSTVKPDVVISVIPRGDTTVYSLVKQLLLNDQSQIVTQCVNTDKLTFRGDIDFKKITPMCGNIVKQIVAKLGYPLWSINLKRNIQGLDFIGDTGNYRSKTKTMIIGADVCHDIQDSKMWGKRRAPKSTVGFVASYDSTFTEYQSSVAIQTKGDELIYSAKELMIAALNAFKAKNNTYPENIILYRDGVSDSQIEKFVRKEIQLFKQAFHELSIQPKLSVIVIQKRISTRLYVENRGFYDSPDAGTVVDTNIVSSQLKDFYLVSSIAPKGATAKPCRLIVVLNELNITTDALQQLTYQLCYLYYNWQGPIKSPVCAQYAHKIAYLYATVMNTDHSAQNMNDKPFYL